MEHNNSIIKYTIALLLGLTIGWFIQPWSEPLTNSENNPSKAITKSVVSTKATQRESIETKPEDSVQVVNSQDDDQSLPAAQESDEQNFATDMKDWSGQEFINYLASLDEKTFWAQINSDELKLALTNSPRLFDEVMSSVLDLQDKKLSRRLLYLFENINRGYSGDIASINFHVEEWIMQRVESEYRSTEWISYLSKLGVQSKESYMSLARRLRDYADPSQTTSILSILARKPYIYNQDFTQDDEAQINQIIEPYFDSDDDAHRMFAVASLSNSSFEQSAPRLVASMSDESQRVRVTAMRVVRDKRFSSPEISNSLLRSLKDKSLSAYERLGAYEVLAGADLNQEQYETVYRFAETERVALEKEFHAERQAATQKSNQ